MVYGGFSVIYLFYWCPEFTVVNSKWCCSSQRSSPVCTGEPECMGWAKRTFSLLSRSKESMSLSVKVPLESCHKSKMLRANLCSWKTWSSRFTTGYSLIVSLPQKSGVWPPHMSWTAHNTELYPDSSALCSPELHRTGHGETLDGKSRISFWIQDKLFDMSDLTLPNKSLQADVSLSLETWWLWGRGFSHNAPLMRFLTTVFLLLNGASLMDFSSSVRYL